MTWPYSRQVLALCWIKISNVLEVGVKVLWEIGPEKAVLAKSMALQQWKEFTYLHAELNHPSEVITQALCRSVRLLRIGMLKSFLDNALGKAKKCGAIKKTGKHSKFFGERFFLVSSFSTPAFGDKKHWLLTIRDWSCMKLFNKRKFRIEKYHLWLS